ncbi:hypothetical protein [Vulcanisaeta distributa]|uniref:hypothetical protein n=1 Tax=Vulcanisaeta distributa TaxID=164451 RepID=UPI0006D12522|nr:hypothetical protein [Vulcanisaeta distributa]
MFTEKIKDAKYNRIALIILLFTLAVSVLVLADVIYYYKGVITVTVSKAPLTFFIGPPNGYVPPYVITSVAPTGGFSLTIQLTNVSYAYYYQVVGMNVYSWCWLYVTNVTVSNELISNLWLYITTPQNQTYCILPVIYKAMPTPLETYQSCTAGYWKNHASVPPWSSQYPPNATLGSIFTALNQYCTELSNYTLLQALYFPRKGPYRENTYCGKVELLLFQAVAALENSATMNYPLTPSEVITMTNNAISSNNTNEVTTLQNYFDQLNEEYDYACSPGTHYTFILPTTGCALQPGTYYISVFVQPITPLYIGQSETINFYLACNVVSNESIPLPPIVSGS